MEKLFRLIGKLEGLSFLLLLFIAMPMKYYAAIPTGVKLLGPIHGALFLGYCALAFWVSSNEEWSWKKQLLAYVAAVVPFGTFWFEKKYMCNERLAS